MKKLFGRDKPKPVKVTPGVRDDVSGLGVGAENHAYPTPRHDRLQSDDQWDLISETDPPLQPLRPPTLSASQSPSLTSIHQSASPVPSPIPRSTSPFSAQTGLPSLNHKPNGGQKEREQQVLRKKPPSQPNSFAAVGILNSLNPSHLEPVVSHELSDDGFTDSSHRDEKDREREKERDKKRFWERSGNKEKEREKERARDKERERERREENGGAPADLSRLLGYLFATSSEDWSLVLEVCDRVSASEDNAKEAARALRRELKAGEVATQLSAARLWAIMLRNCSMNFVKHCASRKFLDTLEDVLRSKSTSNMVRERLLAVLAAAAYASDSESGFRHLWRKVKQDDQPEEGIPFDTDDAMFYPATPRHSAGTNALQTPVVDGSLSPPQQPLTQHHRHSHQYTPPQQPQSQQIPQRPPPVVTVSKTRSSRNRVIPPEEDIRRLFQECKVGRGNASLLSEALAFAEPEDLKKKDIIKEFYARCRASQELVAAQIPWAFAQAERSREASGKVAETQSKDENHGSERERDRERAPSNPKEKKEEHMTTEEKLLAAILASNEVLLEALRLYDDIERVGIEREAEERSKHETRIDRSRLRYDDNDNVYLEPGQPNHVGGSSSSRSPSPSPSASPSPAPSLVVTSSVQSHINQPIPTRPQHPHHVDRMNHHAGSPGLAQSLAPPPPAPHGPRQPTHRSNTPSPERGSLHRVTRTSIESSGPRAGSKLRQDGSEELSSEGDDVKTPVRPSAKALGKRKVTEPEGERTFDPDDMFHTEQNPDPLRTSDDSDSDEANRNPWHRPVHYVYDAAAERAQQRIQEGRLAGSALVTGVH